jgi:hypothetical protein
LKLKLQFALKLGFLALVLPCTGAAQTQEPKVVGNSSESARRIGQGFVPQGRKMMHSVVTGEFGSTPNSVIVLFSGEEDRGFAGWVLLPEGKTHRKLALPAREFPVFTKIRAVFFARAGRATTNDLFVLCEHISGTGRGPGNTKPFYTTYVYGLDGAQISERKDIEDELDPVGQIRSERQVLQKLKEFRN